MKKFFLITATFLIIIILYQFFYLLFPSLPRILPKAIFINNSGEWLSLYCWHHAFYCNYCFMARSPVILTAGFWKKDDKLIKIMPGIYSSGTFDPDRATKTYIYMNNKLLHKFYPKKDENSPTDIFNVFYRENVKGFVIIYYNGFKEVHGVALLDYYGKDFHIIYKTKNDGEFIRNEEDVIAKRRSLILNLENGKKFRIYIPDKFYREEIIDKQKKKVIIIKKSKK